MLIHSMYQEASTKYRSILHSILIDILSTGHGDTNGMVFTVPICFGPGKVHALPLGAEP